MKMIYSKESLFCKKLDNRDRSQIGQIYLQKGQDLDFYSEEGKIIFLVKGSLRFSFGDFSDRLITAGDFFHMPPGYLFTSKVLEDIKIIVIRMYSQVQMCECFATEGLLKEKEEGFVFDLTYLKTNEVVENYLKSLEMYIESGYKCGYLLDLKVKEFFFILRGYYNRKELFQFFYLHLTNDISFSDFIHQNYHKAKTAQELADISNYSLSGLQKRFKKVFGVSVYNWMLDMKAKNILQEISNTDKSFKEISNDYDFSSPAHFSNFCKSQFGTTPGKIRKEGISAVEHPDKKI